MKKNYTTPVSAPVSKWVLYFDGKNTVITDKPEQFDDLNGLVIPISADDAASALLLMLEQKGGN
jgi:hypothetical protein